jgi:hypothetical protein
MRNKMLGLISIVLGLLATGCYPDLIVSNFEATGPATPVGENIEMPAKVTVRNQGNAAAGIFKVSAEYTDAQGTFATPFTVGQEIWYPTTTANLAAGEEITFEGKIVFTVADNEEVTITVIADSCSGDEFMPEYCRVKESNEANNTSVPLTVSLPPGV